jgi:3-keto-disaccharide hydrolase
MEAVSRMTRCSLLVLSGVPLVFTPLGSPPGAAAPAKAGAMTLAPPPGAVVLFNGSDLSHWQTRRGRPAAWRIADEVMITSRGDIASQEKFTDFQLHVEFRVPNMPEAHGQEKGNSGVFLQGRYEIQVLDSYGFKVPGKGDCGAIYNQYAPLVNACKPPMEWQTYDAFFRGARVDGSGQVTEPARVTVLQNGITIQNNVQLLGPTGAAIDDKVGEPGPILLQDHGHPVQYRNVWVVPLPLKGSDQYEPR